MTEEISVEHAVRHPPELGHMVIHFREPVDCGAGHRDSLESKYVAVGPDWITAALPAKGGRPRLIRFPVSVVASVREVLAGPSTKD
jgi:hypothetical protein